MATANTNRTEYETVLLYIVLLIFLFIEIKKRSRLPVPLLTTGPAGARLSIMVRPGKLLSHKSEKSARGMSAR
jgi:hypothetical protein